MSGWGRSKLSQGSRGVARIAIAALVLGLFVWGCGDDDRDGETVANEVMSPSVVVGLGRVEPRARMVDLTSDIAGRVESVHLSAGDRAAAGDTILGLVRGVEAAALRQAEAGVASRRADLEGAAASLKAAESRAERARSQFERTARLYDEGAETEANYEAAETEFVVASEDVRKLSSTWNSAEAALEQALAESARAAAAFDRRILKAPADGRLLALDVAEGAVMSPEMTYGVFGIRSPTVARCEVDELFALMVRVGQRAIVRSHGTGDTLSAGRVAEVGPFLRQKSLFSDDVGELEDRRVRELVVSLDDTTRVLLGARVECVIDVDQAPEGR